MYFQTFHWKAPITNNIDTVKNGEIIEFNCANGFVKDNLFGESYSFQCTNGNFNKTYPYQDLLCKSDFHRNTNVIEVSNAELGSKVLKCDGKNLKVYKVRVKKNDNSFKDVYTVCFDVNTMRAKFVFQHRRNDDGMKSNQTRHDVWGFSYFGKNTQEKLWLSNGYLRRIQKRRTTNAFPEKYKKNKLYPYTFNRGHLAPYADFIDGDEKKASCEYINVAPQWKKLNQHSWSVVERNTRILVGNNPNKWEIYTGTYGSIPTQRGPLYLSPFFDKNGKFVKGNLPVPMLYWKFVYSVENKNLSKAFVGINNPEYQSPEAFPESYVICKPKTQKGVQFHGSEFKGFTYECDVDEFLESIGKKEGIVKVNLQINLCFKYIIYFYNNNIDIIQQFRSF